VALTKLIADGFSPERFRDRSVLVDGINADGAAVARALAARGARVRLGGRVGAGAGADVLRELAAAGVVVSAGELGETNLDGAEALFVDAHLYPSPLTPLVRAARRRGVLVSILADLVLAWRRTSAVGVTGTAGKSSTTAMIARLLDADGTRVHVPRDVFDDNPYPNHELLGGLERMRPPSAIVVELTSSHLEYMHATPDVAVVTNLGVDHLEWHGGVHAYHAAKRRILAGDPAQTAVLCADDATADVFGDAPGRPWWFSGRGEVERGAFVRRGRVVARDGAGEHDLGPLERIPAAAAHAGNVLAAAAAALACGAAPATVADTLPRLRGLPRRLRYAGEAGGVGVWNDGMAITPLKALAGVSRFPADGRLVVVAGGAGTAFWSDGLHRSDHERALIDRFGAAVRERARHAVVFGEGGAVVAEALLAAGAAPARVTHVASLDEAFAVAAGVARPGDAIVLSPVFYIRSEDGERFDAAMLGALAERPSRAPSA
jgi:UDP-N-acetylmuramoylalanine--D-glutamate ligase